MGPDDDDEPVDPRNREGGGAVDRDVSTSTAAPPPAAWYGGAVDRRLHPRPSLWQLPLTAGRATGHAVVRWVACGLAALTALMIAIEPHRVCDAWGSCDAEDWGPTHTLAGDLGASPFIMLALVVALQLLGRQARMAARVLTAIGAGITALFVAATVAFAHFLSSTEGGDGAMALSLLTLVVCVLQLVVEPVWTVRERRAQEASAPVFPHAAVVSGR